MRGYFSVFCHSRLRNLLKNYKVDCRSVLETESECVCVCVCVCARAYNGLEVGSPGNQL